MLLATMAIGMNAAPVDMDAARGMAMRFVRSATAGKLVRPSATMNLAYTAVSTAQPQQADFYVFNTSDGNAFVIVSGDDRAEAVLACGEGSFDVGNVPCNLEAMLNIYREQLEYLHAHPEAQVERIASAVGETIPPLVTCNWGQSMPFYNQCPLLDGERCVTGCVATAMAQVMYYWRYPAELPSLSGYYTSSHRIYVQSLPPLTVDWGNMLNDYNATDYTGSQSAAVAALMRYCGQSVRMDYSPVGSGAYSRDQLSALKKFGYNPGASQLAKGTTSYEEWDVIMRQELLAGRPLLYSAFDPAAGGHAFVVDGYHDGKYHVNWGWNGNYNGYFALGAFDVRGYKFLNGQSIMVDLYPPTPHPVERCYDFVADGIYYRFGDVDGEAWVTCENTDYHSYSGEVVIPATVTHDGQTLAVTAIDDMAFSNCFDLASVTIPESVKRIGQLAFNNCLSLTSVTLPASVERIDARAFVECLGITTVNTPSIQAWLGISFADRYSNPLSMSHSLTVDGQELLHLVIPASTRVVSKHAFTDATALQSVIVEQGVEQIGSDAFAYCTGLSSLTLPDSMLSLGARAFSGCTSLTAAAVPRGITELPSSLFANCSDLTTVSLPETLTQVGVSAFMGCSKLAGVSLPPAVTAIGETAFQSCAALKRVTMPSGLLVIGQGAFDGCASITSMVVPDGVPTIGMNTFNGCKSLTRLTLGQSLASIELKAFAGCKNLAAIWCRGGNPAEIANPDCFDRSIYSRCRLMVPADALDIYRKTGIWPWFTTRRGYTASNPFADVNGDGEINIADAGAVISTILGEDSDPFADVNDDAQVNIADINAVINEILGL